MRINIVVPTHDMVPAMFAYDLAKLSMYTTSVMPSTEIDVTFLTGTHISRARQELLKKVLENEDDYVLWIDSDMRFPKETFMRLARHDVAMVGVNAMRRSLPAWPTAIKHSGLDGKHKPERLYPHKDLKGLAEVESVGFGVLLLQMSYFKNLPPLTDGSWFSLQYMKDTDKWVGEDTSFCQLVREKLGIKIMVDQDLSWLIGHIGQVEIRPKHLTEVEMA